LDKPKTYSSKNDKDDKPKSHNKQESPSINSNYHPQSAYYTNTIYKIEPEQNHSDFEVSSVSSSENNRKVQFGTNEQKKYSSSSNSLKENLTYQNPGQNMVLPKIDHIIEAYVLIDLLIYSGFRFAKARNK
jgi:hypothetical protein